MTNVLTMSMSHKHSSGDISSEPEFYRDYNQGEKEQLKLYHIFVVILGTLVIFSNLIVIVSSGLILKNGQQPKSTYMYLGNVALADTLIGISVIIGIIIPKIYVTHYVCIFQIGLIVSGTLVSLYSVGLIAIDRYLFIIYGLHYKKWVSTTKVRISITLVWILGIVIAYLPLTGLAGDTLDGQRCWFIKLATPPLVILTSIVGFIPIIIVCVLYLIILHHALKKIKHLKRSNNPPAIDIQNSSSQLRISLGQVSQKITNNSNQSNYLNSNCSRISIQTSASISSDLSIDNNNDINVDNHEEDKKRNSNKKISMAGIEINSRAKSNKESREPSKWKAVKVVLFTAGSAICTWIPYFIAALMYVACNIEKTPRHCHRIEVAIASPLALLGLLNSLLNPIIYTWWHNGFRRSIKGICCKEVTKFRLNKC